MLQAPFEVDGDTKVYVLDDEEDVLHFLQVTLTGKGFKPELFRSPSKFMEAVTASTPDIVILDYCIHNMGGPDCEGIISKLYELPHPPAILICSGKLTKCLVKKLLNLGAADALTKDLLIEVSRFVSRYAQTRDILGKKGIETHLHYT